jgi:hypothetical protein
MLRRCVNTSLSLVTLYVAHDAVGDVALYSAAKQHAAALVPAQERLETALGSPLSFGNWWDSSVTSSQGGNLVTAQFVLRGVNASADVRVGLVRPGGAEAHWTRRSNLLYCSPLGPAAPWQLLFANVSLPGAPGQRLMVERVDLLLPQAKSTGVT